MVMVRRVGFTILGIAAVVVWVAMAPDAYDAPSTSEYSNAVSQALEEAELNEEGAGGAPQQQVVNGWVNRDLLSIVAEQNNDLIDASARSAADRRTPALLLLLVLGASLHAATLPTVSRGEGFVANAAGGDDSTPGRLGEDIEGVGSGPPRTTSEDDPADGPHGRL